MDELKIGAEISRANKEKIQSAHDALAELGAACRIPEEVTLIPMRSIDPDETLVNFGGEIKAVQIEGGWKVRAPLVVFTDASDPDLTGDYFDATTDFDMDFPKTSTTYFNHGIDSHFQKRKLSPSTLTKDDFAVWAETILRETDEYEAFLIERGKAGKLGMSSGIPAHLVEREAVGKAMHIKTWPLGKDASFTHQPAEPKTRNIIPLKSLIPTEAPEAAVTAALEVVNEIKSLEVTEITTMELTEEQITKMIETASTKAVEAFAKAQPAAVKAGAVEVLKDECDQPFETEGKFFIAVKNAALYPQQEDPRLRSLKAIGSGNNETIPNEGGYLVPVQTAAGIYENMHTGGELISRIAKDPVDGNTMVYNMVDESSRAAGSRWGGIRGYWMAEAGTKTASKPTFKQLQLKLKKVAALCYATDEILESARTLASWLNRTVPLELQFMSEDAIMNGDGVGKPLGILNSPALLTVVRDTAAQVNYEDICNMWGRRYIGAKDYVWYVSPETAVWLPQMLNGTIPGYMPPGGISGAQYGTLMGRPVIETEYNPTINAIGDILLASMSQYQAIDKGGVQTATSIHVAFVTDEQAFRFVYRVDGAPLWSSVLTPANGSALTVTPFVALSAACAT